MNNVSVWTNRKFQPIKFTVEIVPVESIEEILTCGEGKYDQFIKQALSLSKGKTVMLSFEDKKTAYNTRTYLRERSRVKFNDRVKICTRGNKVYIYK